MPGWGEMRPSSGRRRWPAWVVFSLTFGCCGASSISKRRENDMEPAPSASPGLSVRELPPNIFAVVMATGIVSLALNGAGYRVLAHSLFWLNVSLYALLWVLLISRL